MYQIKTAATRPVSKNRSSTNQKKGGMWAVPLVDNCPPRCVSYKQNR